MISERMSTASVMSAPARCSQNPPPVIAATCAPTPIAPTVCAMVFNVRIEVSGAFRSDFSLSSITPVRGRSFFFLATKGCVMLRSTASQTEQKNDTPMATAK